VGWGDAIGLIAVAGAHALTNVGADVDKPVCRNAARGSRPQQRIRIDRRINNIVVPTPSVEVKMPQLLR
jgi:hypothetical protein